MPVFRFQAHQIIALALFLAIVGAYVVVALYFPLVYIWATYEDLFGEWGQTYLFAIAMLFSALVALQRGRRCRWFFGLLAVALFYTVAEEISWGQRIFEFDSPELFRRQNLQGETNLHNMLVGPYSTKLKDAIEYVLAAALFFYGLIFPLALRLGWSPARWLDELGVASPPIYLFPYFVTAAWLELGPLSFNEAEVAELLVGFALSIMAAQYWFAHRHQVSALSPPPWESEAASRFALFIAAIFFSALVLSSMTTYGFYHSDSKRARIESRLLNGYEKFAGRYERYGQWHAAADLYLRVHEAEPSRTSIIRRLANAYLESGNKELFEFYMQKSLDILLETHAKNPDKISTNLALSRTYRRIGDSQKSEEHGQHAHELALERAALNPGSAHWAYWLGKTYRHLGDYRAARDQFERAFNRRPDKKKYRKAYYDMRQATDE